MSLTRDGFLGWRLDIWQPARGYRGGTDPVLLAASCPARAGARVLDLGCGTGIAALCLGARVPGVALTGLELNPLHAELAARNAAQNDIALRVMTGDVATPPAALRSESFDHVICNPPYFTAGGGTAAQDTGREVALREVVPLHIWVDQALRRAGPNGSVTFIVRTERVIDLLNPIGGRAGAIVVQPLSARAAADPGRVIVHAQKGRRSPLRLRAPLVLHCGVAHTGDQDTFTDEAQAILRDGAALTLF